VKKFIKDRLGTIILFVIFAVLLLVGTFRIKEAKNNAITYSDEYEAPEKTADLSAAGEYVAIAKSDKLELRYNDVKGAIQVVNLENGYVWNSIYDDKVNGKNPNTLWKSIIRSSIAISYNDLKKKDSGAKDLYAAKDCGYLESVYIPNGVSVTYGFLKPGIYVTVEYTLEDDQLVVRIPYDKIQELSRYAITTISVLPYLGACENTNPGYLFYPDGSGSVTTFERASERPANVTEAIYYSYTNGELSYTNLHTTDGYNRYTASMPVCGLKNGENAVFGYVTEGACNTAVVVDPAGTSNLLLNRIGFNVYLRNIYNVSMYNVSTGDNNTSGNRNLTRVDKKLIPENKEIRYSFLYGDKASYSGMASVYRDYLVSNGLLKKAEDTNNNALALKLLMGTKKDGIVFDEYIPMTDYDQAIEIFERLNKLGVSDAQVILEGWQKNYEVYELWGPDRRLGGTSGLKKVSKYAESNDWINVFLKESLMFATSDTKKIDKEDDIAVNGLNLDIATELMSGKVVYLLNPNAVSRRNSELLKKLRKYSGVGIAYEDLGQFIYADFNPAHTYTKNETLKEYMKAFENAKAENKQVAVLGTNAYSLAQADYLYNLRAESYGLSITDYAIPFVQMVVSGLIPYSSEDAGNLCYDLPTQKLQWIEFGSMPYFYLTAESALNLRDTSNDVLFSSTYEDWEPVVVDTYIEFNERLAAIKGRQMIAHTYISSSLRKVEYDNGCVIYINYADKEQKVEGQVVPAKNYVVIGGGR